MLSHEDNTSHQPLAAQCKARAPECDCFALTNHDEASRSENWLFCFGRKEKPLKGSETCHKYTMINKDFPEYREASEQTSSDWSSGQPNRTGLCGLRTWSWLPILLTITTAIGFTATYFFAKTNCHIQKWIFPYVSYTGTEYPESMIFGLILNMEGFLGLTVVFLAWRYYRHMGQRGALNRLALCVGGISCFGVILVGNFQVTKARIPHYIGAGFAFIVGTGYGVLTAFLSRKAFRSAEPPLKHGTCVATIRLALALFMIIALSCLTGVGTYKKLDERNRSQELDYDLLRLDANGSCQDILSKIPPSVLYVDLVGSLTEWILTACLLLCLSLYAYEFQTFQKVKVVLLCHDGPLRCSAFRFESGGNSTKPPLFAFSKTARFTDNDASRKKQSDYRYDSRFEHDVFPASQLRPAVNFCPDSKLRSVATTDSGIEDEVVQNENGSVSSFCKQNQQQLPSKKLHHISSMPNLSRASNLM